MRNIIIISSLLFVKVIQAQIKIDANNQVAIGHLTPNARVDIFTPILFNTGNSNYNMLLNNSGRLCPMFLGSYMSYAQIGANYNSVTKEGPIFKGFFNSITTGGFYLYSDKNLKDNILPLQNGLKYIEQLQPVTYTMNKPEEWYGLPKNNKTHFGFIAQDVQDAIPELVEKPENENDFYKLNYIEIIPLLVLSIKEQQAQIDELKSARNNERRAITGNITEAKLYQNTPNPFSKSTQIEFEIPDKCDAQMLISKLDGTFVKSYTLQQYGKNTLTIQANELNAGIYFYTLLCNNMEIDTKKMILTK